MLTERFEADAKSQIAASLEKEHTQPESCSIRMTMGNIYEKVLLWVAMNLFYSGQRWPSPLLAFWTIWHTRTSITHVPSLPCRRATSVKYRIPVQSKDSERFNSSSNNIEDGPRQRPQLLSLTKLMSTRTGAGRCRLTSVKPNRASFQWWIS